MRIRDASLPVLLLACSFSAAAENDVPPAAAQAARKVRDVIGHRGSCLDTPENTLAGVRRAAEARATVVEIDVRTTRDGELVCLHDEDLARTTNGRGKVSERSLKELQGLDAGSWFAARFKGERIPTLREVLAASKGKIGVMLDLKESGEVYLGRIAAEVRRHGEPKRTVLGVRSVEHATRLHKLLPEARQIGLVPTTASIEAFAKAGVTTIRLWPRWLADKTLVPSLRKRGLGLLLGTGKGTRAEVLPLLVHQPEALSSDDPAALRRTLAEIAGAGPVRKLEPVPDKLVVLTFDDASKSHFTVARPLLRKYGFGATFFVTEGFDFPTNKRDYLTWDEIAQLHRDGFEIGNHTRDHVGVTAKALPDLPAQVRSIAASCRKHGIPAPVSFAYPGNAIHPAALPVLADLGIRFARRGGSPEYPYKEGRGFAYEPGLDHPLLVPTAGDARPGWTLDDFKRAVSQARHGKIAVLQFHGVPDTAHAWVTTSQKQFESYLKYLADGGFKVIAMRDLEKYADPSVTPSNPLGVIEDRQRLLKLGQAVETARPAKGDPELRSWLENLVTHRFHPAEMGAALGLSEAEARKALARLKIDPARPVKLPTARLLVLPYPGGRHPRIGFLDGAIRPQRETKLSVFTPWAGGGYAVADVPEAVWFNSAGKRELLYLAHTHVPTVWDRKGVTLPPLEWQRQEDGSLTAERRLPGGITFGTRAEAGKDGVRMELWVTNGTKTTLTGMNVQMCVMLKGLTGFEERTNDNKVFVKPFAACRDRTGKRWVITGWTPAVRVWGNPPCPCLHSDPQVPDCPPGATRKVTGWLSFYEGSDISGELRRLREKVFPAEGK